MTMRLPSDSVAAQLANLYATAEAHLRASVMQAVTSGALGTASYRRRALHAVQQILATLQQQATPRARQAVSDAYHVGAGIADHHTGIDNTPRFGGHIHTQAVRVLADSLVGRLDDAVTHVGRQVDDVFRREQLRATAQMLITQGDVRTASRALADQLTAQGVKAFTDRAGRQWGLANYAEMAIRTVSRQAVTEGTKNALLERHVDLVTMSSHASSCDQCAPLEGKTFSLTGLTPGYPVLESPPPIHPRCRHVIFPAAANLDLALNEGELQRRIDRNRATVAA